MPRTTPTTEGKTFTRTCAWCGIKFKSDNARTKYCTLEHKKAANNQAYYERHAEAVSEKNNERQKRQRELAKLYKEGGGHEREQRAKEPI